MASARTVSSVLRALGGDKLRQLLRSTSRHAKRLDDAIRFPVG